MNIENCIKYIPPKYLGISCVVGVIGLCFGAVFLADRGIKAGKDIEISRNGFYVRQSPNLSSNKDTNIHYKKEETIIDCEPKEWKNPCETKLTKEESSKKIMIIGGDEFLRNLDAVYGIAKEFNITKDQLVIYNDYTKITNQGRKIISKIQFNDDYIGIIFGSIPHSVAGIAGASSMIEYCKQEGFPFVCECLVSDSNGTLKASKQSFKKALGEVIKEHRMDNDNIA